MPVLSGFKNALPQKWPNNGFWYYPLDLASLTVVLANKVGEITAAIVQVFAQELAVEHTRHFTSRCSIEGVSALPTNLSLSAGPPHPPFLPAPENTMGCHIKCTTRPINALEHIMAEFHSSKGSSHVGPQSGTTSSRIRQRRPADAFQAGIFVKNSIALAPTVSSKFASDSTHDRFPGGKPLISIGPHSDAIIDRFKMGDHTLPRLHELISTIQSSRWEAILRSARWDLSYEQAANLAKALKLDVREASFSRTAKQTSTVISVVCRALVMIIALMLLPFILYLIGIFFV
ncbi:hypothetical protein BJ138DRAFT_1106801 [Hygrophoropsis aurantiaca]|uniref:Uncharacterized protein n=1 Tax=Hygrophoropsis aurantiaca TaxID=72124 RepID=A0ACB7ZTD5_9AGAM|nr:hypothetical protein BJ138DRAFT_1106801 [Hygrophoropsis aurantiaca]